MVVAGIVGVIVTASWTLPSVAQLLLTPSAPMGRP